MIVSILMTAAVVSSCHPVDGDRIFIRDIAAVDRRFEAADPGKVAGYSPQPVATRVFWPVELKRLADQNGISSSDPFPRICFERRTHLLAAGEVMEAIKVWAPVGASVEVSDISRFPVPAGALTIPMPSAGPSAADGSVLLRGYITYNEMQHFPMWAKVKVKVRRRLLIAESDILPGQDIRSDLVRRDDREGGIESIHFASELAEVIGRVPTRRLASGTPIPLDALEPAKQVVRGAIVKVEVQSGAARLVLDAEAERGGWTGDVIPMRNPSSGKAFRGKIVGENRVEVAPTGGSLTGTEKK